MDGEAQEISNTHISPKVFASRIKVLKKIGHSPCALNFEETSTDFSNNGLENRVRVNDLDNISFSFSEGLPNAGEVDIQILLIPHDGVTIQFVLVYYRLE